MTGACFLTASFLAQTLRSVWRKVSEFLMRYRFIIFKVNGRRKKNLVSLVSGLLKNTKWHTEGCGAHGSAAFAIPRPLFMATGEWLANGLNSWHHLFGKEWFIKTNSHTQRQTHLLPHIADMSIKWCKFKKTKMFKTREEKKKIGIN